MSISKKREFFLEVFEDRLACMIEAMEEKNKEDARAICETLLEQYANALKICVLQEEIIQLLKNNKTQH